MPLSDTLNRQTALLTILTLALVVESTIIAFPLIITTGNRSGFHPIGIPETYAFGPPIFNQPISNDTEQSLRMNYSGSWTFTIANSLIPGPAQGRTEAQVALAPSYQSEALSIPTLIVQERADGLTRVEYFAQNWPNTYGLILYNSTTLDWKKGMNVTLQFIQFGPPSQVNPSIAPRPNGNLTILIAGRVVVSNYMIAWAPLGDVYLYGLAGSDFVGGTLRFTVQNLSRN